MISKQEIQSRIDKFYTSMNKFDPNWDIVIIVDKMNKYYYTGTIQDSVLIFLPNGDVHLFVKKSYKRAKIESLLENIHPMNSYRDILSIIDKGYEKGYVELEIIPYNMLTRINKHMNISNVLPIDRFLASQRIVKSQYEIGLLEEAGVLHAKVFYDLIPNILIEGMSELNFATECFVAMMSLGHHGTSRLNMFQPEFMFGQIGFGVNSLYPTNFDGPGGCKGVSAAVPILGNPNKKLQKGDLVFVDFSFGIQGYHTDKTQVYMYKDELSSDISNAHKKCIDIQTLCASKLKSGNIASEIYTQVMDTLDEEFKKDFMGYEEQVKFLGHGVGLYINESPVIAKGFDVELEKNMVIALEPKKGIAGVGMVGVEDTYIVEDDGGRCITSGGTDIIIL